MSITISANENGPTIEDDLKFYRMIAENAVHHSNLLSDLLERKDRNVARFWWITFATGACLGWSIRNGLDHFPKLQMASIFFLATFVGVLVAIDLYQQRRRFNLHPVNLSFEGALDNGLTGDGTGTVSERDSGKTNTDAPERQGPIQSKG